MTEPNPINRSPPPWRDRRDPAKELNDLQATKIGSGLFVRPESPADRDFAAMLFRAVRQAEFAQAGWPAASVEALLTDQFRLQSLHFAAAFPAARRWILARGTTSGEHPIGRLYVDCRADCWHIVDIAILPEEQGRGTGQRAIGWLAGEVRAAGASALDLQVAHGNARAAALYRRLGFRDIGGISATHAQMRLAL